MMAFRWKSVFYSMYNRCYCRCVVLTRKVFGCSKNPDRSKFILENFLKILLRQTFLLASYFLISTEK